MTADSSGAVDPLAHALLRHEPQSPREAAELARVRDLVAAGNGWDRSTPLHVTASAVIVHPPTRRVLLRWHQRQQDWLQVGGHADVGERDPFAVALREAREETGLADLAPWPDTTGTAFVHLAIVPVPAATHEPAHEHADIRYVLATRAPDEAAPETPAAPLRWLPLAEASELTKADNLRVTLHRITQLLAGGSPPTDLPPAD
jgi:8-oxo-dGTP pyrophosphatase MutT (NUDIX family)